MTMGRYTVYNYSLDFIHCPNIFFPNYSSLEISSAWTRADKQAQQSGRLSSHLLLMKKL
jgi:hypothetical protein